MSYIELENIQKKYNIGKQSEVHALKGIDLRVEKGEMVSVMGVSGSGKSTLLHIIGCLDRSTSGIYLLEGEKVEIKSNSELAFIRNKKIGFVLQEFGLLLNRTVYDNVSIPLLFAAISFRHINKTVKSILEQLGIDDLIKRKVEQLSGGQKQRVAIARALVNNPDIILADEPSGSLDSGTMNEIMALFKDVNKSGKTVIIVTHDEQVSTFCSRNITIKDGKIQDNFYKDTPVCSS